MNPRPRILIVDDEPFNVDYLQQELEELDYDTLSAANGQEALDRVRDGAPDVVLLDIMMPVLDGFGVLARLKADKATRDIPVIVISALSDLQNVVAGIKQGAEDYLPKPFDPVLLHARLGACLEKKRYRDQEVEYLRQVERLTSAAEALEANALDLDHLSPVAARADALGNLARVFQRMAREVHAREQRLRRQIEQLKLDIDERQAAAQETAAVFIPMDRRQALARGRPEGGPAGGRELPDRTHGAALFADISGFTPLTAALARELGFQRGAEELTRQLNRVYAALIDEVHRYGGSVVGFSGDAVTCWFDDHPAAEEAAAQRDAPALAVACALAMQAAMRPFAALTTPAGSSVSLAIKVAVAAGPARRLQVGDPRLQVLDALAGQVVDELAAAELQAARGEVVITLGVAEALGSRLTAREWREGGRFAVVDALTGDVAPASWPELAVDAVPEAQARSWLLPPVYEKVRSGRSDLLSELRPAAMLFLRFGGLDYDRDDQAGVRLDAFLHWVQRIVDRHGGTLVQLTFGDKGSYVYLVFGAPVAHEDDAARAVAAALELRDLPTALGFITGVSLGLAHGQVRAGAYGSPAQRAYGALGEKTNLAARLMMRAEPGEILCDDAIYQAARGRFEFEPLPPLTLKGLAQPVDVYRPAGRGAAGEPASAGLAGRAAERALFIDRLSPAEQLVLKTASVIGPAFTLETLQAILPEAVDLPNCLQALEGWDLIARQSAENGPGYSFRDALTHETAYNLMLFAQRRQVHRAIAEWLEAAQAADLAPHYAALAHHWQRAEDPAKAIDYLEKAGEQAKRRGNIQEALQYYHDSLALEARAAVLSSDYTAPAG